MPASLPDPNYAIGDSSNILEQIFGLFKGGGGGAGAGMALAGANPLMAGGAEVLKYLSKWLGGQEERKHKRWQRGQQKDFYDFMRWNEMNKPAVTPQARANIQNKAMDATQPAHADMSWMAKMFGGARSPQSQGTYLRTRAPIDANIGVNLDKWMQEMNLRKKQGDQGILAGMVR